MSFSRSYFQYSPILILLVCIIFSCKNANTNTEDSIQSGQITKSTSQIVIDGNLTDEAWSKLSWNPIDQTWIGKPPTESDFSGQYKITWDDSFLYILAEIADDTLIDIHEDGLDRYWDDDCLEIFVDADGSGGNHQYNHNAFAYHLSLDGRVVDVNPDSAFQYYDEHCTFKRTTSDGKSIWEVAVRIYPDTYVEGGDNMALSLQAGKKMGFALAYCDNDHSAERENFMGSIEVEGTDKNRGWIDAGIFEKIELVEE